MKPLTEVAKRRAREARSRLTFAERWRSRSIMGRVYYVLLCAVGVTIFSVGVYSVLARDADPRVPAAVSSPTPAAVAPVATASPAHIFGRDETAEGVQTFIFFILRAGIFLLALYLAVVGTCGIVRRGRTATTPNARAYAGSMALLCATVCFLLFLSFSSAVPRAFKWVASRQQTCGCFAPCGLDY